MNIDYEAWEKRAMENIPGFIELMKKLIDEGYVSVDNNGNLLFDYKFEHPFPTLEWKKCS